MPIAVLLPIKKGKPYNRIQMANGVTLQQVSMLKVLMGLQLNLLALVIVSLNN